MRKMIIVTVCVVIAVSFSVTYVMHERSSESNLSCALTQDQKDTLETYRLIDTVEYSEKPGEKAYLYEMTYKADYAFDAYLKIGSGNYRELGNFLAKYIFHREKGEDASPRVKHGCTSFSARNGDNHVVVGRNFDLKFSMPVSIMKLSTKPAGGYASISFVYLPHLSYFESTDEFFLPYRPRLGSTNNLIAPYVMMDGMNEAGVAVSTLDASDARQIPSVSRPGKVAIWHPCRMRLILDYAKSVNEAIALLEKYDTFFTEDDKDHIMITDRSGDSAVIEYHSGGMRAIRSGKPWQVVSNYTLGGKSPDDLSRCERYKIAWTYLSDRNGVIGDHEAMSLLVNISLSDKTMDTFWSALYDLQSGDIRFVSVSNMNKMRTFHLDMLR